jgi:penicillin-binding protein 2
MSKLHRILKAICFSAVLLLASGAIATARVRSAKPHGRQVRSRPVTRINRHATARDAERNINRGSIAGRRQRLAETRRQAARLRAERARQAALARQRALDEALRAEVRIMIGRDNSQGEDPEVRRVAVNALGNHAGTVVVMDPKTGRIYSIVNQEWAVRRGFKPCSTIKLVTGLAGLNERVIDPIDTTNVSGAYHINLTDALAYSNNTYFQQVGGRVGFEKMISYARRLGLGEKTGINAPNEFQGQVPRTKSGFAVNHMSSHGDDFKVTAIQLATLVSAMANGGKLLAPIVPGTNQETTFKTRVRRLINIDLDSLRYMVPGMVGSVSYGSGRRAQDPQETVAGKTGTCIEQGTWVGLFASYAPLANPRLAVVVIARGADAHGHFPAAVAGKIYRDLNGRFGTPTNLQIAASRDGKIDSAVGRAQRDPKASLDEEEKDEEAAELGDVDRNDSTPAAPIASKAAPAGNVGPKTISDNKVRRVLMPIPQTRVVVAKRPVTTPASPGAGSPPQQRPRRVNNNNR